MESKVDIAIAGAGIGGLSAAALLAQDGHKVVVFDQFEKPLPVGSGLVIQPVGQEVLARIGALEAALTGGGRIGRMLGFEATSGRRVLDVWYDRKAGQAFGLAIHRAVLFDALYKAAKRTGVDIVANARVTAASGGQITLANGQSAGRFDLVVDASGAGSVLSPLKARPLPYGAIWGNVDWPADTPLPMDRLSQVYRRADRMVGVLPLGRPDPSSGPKAAVFWSLPRDAHERWVEAGLAQWKAEASALWPEITPFLAGVTDPAQMNMARYSHGTLRRPYGDRLVMIGDAAHRASPQLGQGANMALLDAQALAAALRVAGCADALKLYARARRWHVRIYQGMSHLFTPQYQSDSRILPVVRDRVLFPLSMIPPVLLILSKLVRGDLVSPFGRLN
ncbi:MAG TPA: FAD-dependent monooxygenase [Aliiroseovarius sp.]|nr:FAD-dependent monooxygenase [Aliiroseovarius sp.]